MRDELASHIRALRRYALVLTRDPDTAEDLVQDALARALGAAGGYRKGADLRVWLFAILHNRHIDRQRRLRTAREALDGMEEPSVPPSQIASLELRETLEALAGLPDEQRETLVLVSVEGLSYAQAAEVTQAPIGTVMSRLYRAREALRQWSEGGGAIRRAVGRR